MKSKTRAITIASVGLAAAGLLAACGGSSETAASGSVAASSAVGTTAPTAAASPSASLVGGDPGTWSPVNITQNMNGTKVKIVVGQAAIFTDLPPNDATNTIIVRAKPKGVVQVTQQGITDGVSSNAGFVGIAPGKTTVTVYDGKPKDPGTQVIMKFTVRVKAAPAAGVTPSASGSAVAQ